MAEDLDKIVESKDGVRWTIAEWSEHLNGYSLDQVKYLYWDIFDQEARQSLNGYFKNRCLNIYRPKK